MKRGFNNSDKEKGSPSVVAEERLPFSPVTDKTDLVSCGSKNICMRRVGRQRKSGLHIIAGGSGHRKACLPPKGKVFALIDGMVKGRRPKGNCWCPNTLVGLHSGFRTEDRAYAIAERACKV